MGESLIKYGGKPLRNRLRVWHFSAYLRSISYSQARGKRHI